MARKQGTSGGGKKPDLSTQLAQLAQQAQALAANTAPSNPASAAVTLKKGIQHVARNAAEEDGRCYHRVCGGAGADLPCTGYASSGQAEKQAEGQPEGQSEGQPGVGEGGGQGRQSSSQSGSQRGKQGVCVCAV